MRVELEDRRGRRVPLDPGSVSRPAERASRNNVFFFFSGISNVDGAELFRLADKSFTQSQRTFVRGGSC